MSNQHYYKHTYSLVACARWEAEEIVEWVEYHRALGFDHFYIYSNDDTPDPLFKALMPYIIGSKPIVTYKFWPRLGEQSEMYADFLRHYKTETRWAMFLDIDEFITLRSNNNIGQFLAKFPDDVDCIYFNWLMYGNNGKLKRDGRSNLETLTRRADVIDVHTKTIWRTEKVTEELAREGAARTRNAYTHFWNGYNFDNFIMRDVINRPVDDYATNFPEAAHAAIGDRAVSDRMIDTAYVAHFIIKSEEDFIRRAERGGFAAQVQWKERYESGAYKELLSHLNCVEDLYLKNIWTWITRDKISYGPSSD
ncbi:glycosyltransferase family 92 protein [Methylobacterium sp. NI91]|nr:MULTISPECIES: glycosyltransferase family 2 protein [unclassified Methylobacterium]QIJ77131.1 glycosyltransferase family 92 protein [Methylobacterium sp. CLZ]QIJ82035.1 glycosyltransferase family 92 protein [Methylobacterium sp. NI91]